MPEFYICFTQYIAQGYSTSWWVVVERHVLIFRQKYKVLQGNILEFFIQDIVKSRFWIDGHNQGFFFQNQYYFFDFQKRTGETSPPPFVPHLLMWLNMPHYSCMSLKHPWKCLNKLFFVKALNMFYHITCLSDFWRCFRFLMYQGSEYDAAVRAKVTQTSEYVGIWLNMPQ